MHRETVRELIEASATAGGTLLKEVFVHRKEMEQLEAQHETQVELARLRNQEQESDDGTETDNPEQERPGSPQPDVAGIEAEIDELMAEEMCAVCRELLRSLKDRPPRQQIRGVKEYGEFKQELSDNADAEDLRALLRETVVLHSIFEENLNGMV